MPSLKSENQSSPASPNALKWAAPKAWLLAARPKTWIASLSPVLIGTCMAAQNQPIRSSLFILTLLFSLLIQIGTNFANDYFDFLKGADTSERIGPKRAVQQGWISPFSMLIATLFTFAIAFFLAIPLMALAGWWSLSIAIAAVLFGILYTGGPIPLGYLGLGEILVFVFFGPVAVCGSYFLQTASLNSAVFLSSLAPGLLSCSLLIANNLRDIETDRRADKKTLAVRFGRTFGSWEYGAALFGSAMTPILLVLFYQAPWGVLVASLILPLSSPYLKRAFHFQNPLELIPVLQGSALLHLFYTISFCLLW